jgi:parallel beta-helix repeat protein
MNKIAFYLFVACLASATFTVGLTCHESLALNRCDLVRYAGAGTEYNQTITIMPNGSVQPSDAPIQISGDVYTLTSDLNVSYGDNGIVIQRDNVTLDGANHTIQTPLNILYMEGHGVDVTDERNVTIKNIWFTHFLEGIYLFNTNSSLITENTLVFCDNNIWLEQSCNDAVIGNIVNASGDRGITLWGPSNGNTVAQNIVFDNAIGIIFQYQSNHNNASSNSVIASRYSGIYVKNSSGNNVFGNRIIGNNVLRVPPLYINQNSTGNTFYENRLENNTQGPEIADSNNNLLYGNYFLDNSTKVSTSNSVNFWDNGSYGNFWSDYLTKYPSAKEIDHTGIGDTPYGIDPNNVDHYPLMNQPAVPEFLPYMILPLFMIITLLGAIIIKRKRNEKI